MAQAEKPSALSRIAGWTSDLDPIEVGATCLCFLLALPFLEVQGFALETFLWGGLIGLPLVVVGFIAASRCRTVPERNISQRAELALLALLAGIGVGTMNLGANVGLATAGGGIRALLQEHFAEPLPWTRVASVAVVEEVVSRLFVMSVVAWLVSRFVDRSRPVFLTALIVSALLFALPHLLGRPMPDQQAFAALYASGVVLKSGVAGLALGCLFWRWGLPYAVLCHFAANGLHQALEPWFFP